MMDMRYQRPHTRWLRSVMGVVVLITCLRVWLGPITTLPQAQAQIPDSGLQRKKLLAEARRTNQLLSEIKQLLGTHTFNVRFAGADKKAIPPARQGS